MKIENQGMWKIEPGDGYAVYDDVDEAEAAGTILDVVSIPGMLIMYLVKEHSSSDTQV